MYCCFQGNFEARICNNFIGYSEFAFVIIQFRLILTYNFTTVKTYLTYRTQ